MLLAASVRTWFLLASLPRPHKTPQSGHDFSDSPSDAWQHLNNTLHTEDLMTEVRKIVWNGLDIEQLSPLIGRRLIYTASQMLAHVYLTKGAIVPAHDHHNEQFTYVLSGALRFWIGEQADSPGEDFIDVQAGEVLVIPGGVRHRAEALEDTLDVDIFNPPRQDWIDKNDAYLRGDR